jgi:hypothetical protein
MLYTPPCSVTGPAGCWAETLGMGDMSYLSVAVSKKKSYTVAASVAPPAPGRVAGIIAPGLVRVMWPAGMSSGRVYLRAGDEQGSRASDNACERTGVPQSCS